MYACATEADAILKKILMLSVYGFLHWSVLSFGARKQENSKPDLCVVVLKFYTYIGLARVPMIYYYIQTFIYSI